MALAGSTKIKMGNQGDQGASGEFIERRRAALERFINRTANHPILRVDPDFRDFLESGEVTAEHWMQSSFPHHAELSYCKDQVILS